MDRKSLVCDLAETYGIFDFKGVPVPLLGTLVAGLRDDSRIGRKINGVHGSTVELLLAELIDSVNALVYGLLAEEGTQRPESRKAWFIAGQKEDKELEKEYESFATGEAFKARRAELLGKR